MKVSNWKIVLLSSLFMVGMWGTIYSVTFYYKSYSVPSSSNVPSVLPGDKIYAKMGIKTDQLYRGQHVVFPFPKDPKITYIKRIVGLPGELIEVKNGHLLVNGKTLEIGPASLPSSLDSFNEHSIAVRERGDKGDWTVLIRKFQNENLPPFSAVVPQGQVFVMGDNRDDSYDSRHWGGVPMSSVLGELSMIWFSFDNSKVSVRWDRIGKSIE